MLNRAKKSGLRAARAIFTATMLYLFCWLLFSNPAPYSDTQVVVVETLTMSEVADNSASLLSSYSSASSFEHQKQSAQWQFERTEDTAFSAPVANAYLLTEPIVADWFLVAASSRFRVSGWKDASIQFKIKNAFI